MELRDYLRLARRSWVLIVTAMLVGLSGGAVATLAQSPMYAANVTIFVSTATEGNISELQQGNTFTQQRVATYAGLATTPAVLEPVIEQLGLPVSPRELAENVSAEAQANTTLIDLRVTDEDPGVAATKANAVSESLSAVIEDVERTEGQTVSPVRLTIVESALPPERPTSPRLSLNLAIGLVLGTMAGVGLALLRELLDTRIRSEKDVANISDVPVIGGIPFDTKVKDHPLVVREDPLSPRAEAFRALRTNLQFLESDKSERVFAITSSIQAESKSTTAGNLAVALSDAGQRVLLLDADLRRPRVAEYMGVEGSVGLTDLLIGRAEPQDVIQRLGDSNLFILPAGQIPPNPSELLGSDAMRSALAEFARVFDVVLIDCPPLLPVTDAAILSRHVTGVIVVAAAGKVNRTQLSGALSMLEQVNASVSGVVLTMVPTKGPDSATRYGYSYGYRYYREEEKRSRTGGRFGRRQGRDAVHTPV